MPDGTDLLRRQFLAIRYSSYVMIFAAVLISLAAGGQNLLGFVGPLLLLGAIAGSVALHKAWTSSFRLLYGLVTVLAAFWAQFGTDIPFIVGWAVLLLGMASMLFGGISLETRYLATAPKDPGSSTVGSASMRRSVLRMGAYFFVVTVVSLLVVLASFAFVLGTFPIWAVGACTAVLVLVFAYLVSNSAEATDQSG
jgi:hypothetical protein